MRWPLRAKPLLYLFCSPVGGLFAVAVITGIGGAMGNRQIGSWNTKAMIAAIIVAHIEPSRHMAVNTLGSLSLLAVHLLS